MTKWTMLQAQRDFQSGALRRCEIQIKTGAQIGGAYAISFEPAFGSEGVLVDGRYVGHPTRYFETIAEAQAAARKIGFAEQTVSKHA